MDNKTKSIIIRNEKAFGRSISKALTSNIDGILKAVEVSSIPLAKSDAQHLERVETLQYIKAIFSLIKLFVLAVFNQPLGDSSKFYLVSEGKAFLCEHGLQPVSANDLADLVIDLSNQSKK